MKASFIEPMLLLRTEKLAEGPAWQYEIKLDGYRAIAFKTGGRVQLRSRNDNDFNRQYAHIVKALEAMPDETVIDGEVVALDEAGKPSFNLLQNYVSSKIPILFYAFDVMILRGKDVTGEPLSNRTALLEEHVLTRLDEPIRSVGVLEADLSDLIVAVRAQGLEGLVAKRKDSRYEAGKRSGAWQKMRTNRGQEFVIGGYTKAPGNFDALIFGYYDQGVLKFAGKTRNGFTPIVRNQLMKRFKGMEIPECPFVGLPEKRPGRWGQGITEEKMKDCVWLRPELVGQFEFVEWTPDAHLRHSKFIAMREDKKASDIRRE